MFSDILENTFIGIFLFVFVQWHIGIFIRHGTKIIFDIVYVVTMDAIGVLES